MKDILVHIDDSERTGARIDIAVSLAKRFSSRLIGLFARLDSHTVSAVARRASDTWKQAAEIAEADFRHRAEAAGVEALWWPLAHGAPEYVLSETAFCCRYAELVVMGQHQPENRMVPEILVEKAIADGGRPVLVVPHSGSFPVIGERILVAWNGSREATRAVHDSMPLLVAAKEVTVLSLHNPDSSLSSGEPPVSILDHLAANGVKARGERLAGEQIGKMDMLLSRLCDLGADMLVMGAHVPERISLARNSGTRHILRQMTQPVLFAT